MRSLGLFCCLIGASILNAETNAIVESVTDDVSPPPPVAVAEAGTNFVQQTQELMSAILHLQEKVHETQLSVERARADADAAATRNEMTLAGRLEVIEASLAESREQHFEALQSTYKHMATMAVVFAVAGFLALGVTSWLQWRTASRLSEVVSAPQRSLALPPPPALNTLATENPAAASEGLRQALARLEERITEFELGSAPTPLPHRGGTNGEEESEAFGSNGEETHQDGPESERIRQLLKEGQQLLASDEVEEAVARFDELLELEPQHAEALLRKGTAFERLQRNQEAIECYNKAIEADERLTMAYLYKGGLFNRMERFGEAMDCYEQALKVQGERRVG